MKSITKFKNLFKGHPKTITEEKLFNIIEIYEEALQIIKTAHEDNGFSATFTRPPLNRANIIFKDLIEIRIKDGFKNEGGE